MCPTARRRAPGNCQPPDYCPNWHFATNYYIFDQFGRVVAEYDETVLKRLYYYGPTGRMSMRQISPHQSPVDGSGFVGAVVVQDDSQLGRFASNSR